MPNLWNSPIPKWLNLGCWNFYNLPKIIIGVQLSQGGTGTNGANLPSLYRSPKKETWHVVRPIGWFSKVALGFLEVYIFPALFLGVVKLKILVFLIFQTGFIFWSYFTYLSFCKWRSPGTSHTTHCRSWNIAKLQKVQFVWTESYRSG